MKRLLHVDIFSVLFGLGTWLCVNGLWVELPLLVQQLPEGWNLPSYLSVVVQLANIGPILYTLLNKCFPKQITEVRAVYFIMLVGLVSTILLVLFWQETTVIAGAKHSTALLSFVFFLAAVDCSSRVTYLPFMAKFQEIYLTSYFIGEGLSGFFPSIIALSQGVGGNPECRNNSFGNGTESFSPDPRFSVDIFFYLLFTFTLVSALAFYCLNVNSMVEAAYSNKPFNEEENGGTDRGRRISEKKYRDTVSSSSGSSCEHSIFEPPQDNQISVRDNDNQNKNANQGGSPSTRRLGLLHDDDIDNETSFLIGMPQKLFLYLLIVQTVVSMLSNGVFPSIQSYSCLPYGNVAYHLAITLSNMANPAVCMLAFFVPPPTKYSVTAAAGLSFLLSGYVMATAVMSPSPPLVGLVSGEILLILSWIILVALFTYVRVSVATMLRVRGQSGLLWCGATTQIGSTVGAIIAFVIVNYSNVFTPYYPCT